MGTNFPTSLDTVTNPSGQPGQAPFNAVDAILALEARVGTAPVTLVDAATIATDASLSKRFRVTLTADRILGVPTSPTDGQMATWEVTASGGARTLTLTTGSSGAFKYGSDITALTPTASGTTDLIGAVYNAAAARWWVVAYVKGF